MTPAVAPCQCRMRVEHVELAYATTAYGAQGSTVPTSHVLVGEHTGAASAYVGMTRGRERNVAHLVADSTDDARSQWIAVFGRDRADLGPTHAARLAADAIDRYGPTAPRRPALRPPAPSPAPGGTSHPPAQPGRRRRRTVRTRTLTDGRSRMSDSMACGCFSNQPSPHHRRYA